MINQNTHTPVYIGLFLIIALQLFLIGMFMMQKNQVTQTTSKVSLPQSSPAQSKLLTSQTALIQGKILKIDGQMMTVQNEKGVTADIEFGKAIAINGPQGLDIATTSAAIKKLQLNVPVDINLVLVGDKYLVTSVIYR